MDSIFRRLVRHFSASSSELRPGVSRLPMNLDDLWPYTYHLRARVRNNNNNYHNHNHHNHNHNTHNNQAVYPKSALVCVTCCEWTSAISPFQGAAAAQRRRQRRLRSRLRHERTTVAMALAERTHHSPRGQKNARAREWGHEMRYTATILDPSTPQPVFLRVV